ncbi:hypothetical protein CBF34_07845 [Vagococcus penaei]|uniref:Uncharacterized protein n=1 Tax=Vagococcus penaei TaxID=633807 RepID=A0A1Q2D4F1_9ENTE|nr:GNAT family N-acetyltransferase [Vagococcus penaei]AQP53201.1 hypothetical protein BW732_02430 [Vagococcus penaei]RSU01003.1 hypothetical protein CBF34_07845 [Vagococcus penaei]
MANFYSRRATLEDLPAIMDVIASGVEILKKRGVPQWQAENQPNTTVISADIAEDTCHVLIIDGKISGVACLQTLPEVSYDTLNSGAWLTSETHYATIHRFAICSDIGVKGMGHIFMGYLLSFAISLGYDDVRIDTHSQNLAMQRVIKRAGFVECGDILLPIKNGERLVYQWLRPL